MPHAHTHPPTCVCMRTCVHTHTHTHTICVGIWLWQHFRKVMLQKKMSFSRWWWALPRKHSINPLWNKCLNWKGKNKPFRRQYKGVPSWPLGTDQFFKLTKNSNLKTKDCYSSVFINKFFLSKNTVKRSKGKPEWEEIFSTI